MKDRLPIFKYHPSPLKTGNAQEKKFKCACCSEEKIYAYVGPVYSVQNVDSGTICLCCIENGSAAKKFDATFTDLPYNLNDSEISKEDLEEFYKCTPGYISWQGQVWLTHCGKICAFHGDFNPVELQKIYGYEENKSYLEEALGCNDQELKEIVSGYNPKKSTQPAFYKFQCIVCEKVLAHTDFT